MTLRYLLVVVIVAALTCFLSYNTYATARLLRAWQPSANPLLSWPDNVLRLALVFLCLLLGWLSGLPPEILGWTFPAPIAQIAVGVLLGALLAGFFYVSTRLLIVLGGQRFYSTLLLELITPKSKWELAIVLVAFAPAVLVEELLFRSLWVGGFSPLLPPSLLAMGVGLFFGLLHTPQGLWGVIGAGLAGVLFGFLFLWSGSILLPVVAHHTANAVQILIAMRLYNRELEAN